MHALTISQPYASLIADGAKWVENRTWATPYRGPLAIHAGKGTQYLTAKELQAYPTGAIIATCELVTCINLQEVFLPGERADSVTVDLHLPEQQRRELEQAGIRLQDVLQHEHTEGPVAWVLTEVRKCEPVPITGKQQLWPVPLDVLTRCVAELAF